MSSTTEAPPPFLRLVSEAIDTYTGGELAAHINQLHESAMGPLHEQLQTVRESAGQMAQSAQLEHHLAQAAADTLQKIARRQVEAVARATALTNTVAMLERIADKAAAASSSVSPEQIRQVIAAQPPVPAFRPQILAFTPSTMYRVGHFVADEGQMWRSLPFAGFTLYEDNPDRLPTNQLAFVVDGHLLARPQLLQQYGLNLSHLE